MSFLLDSTTNGAQNTGIMSWILLGVLALFLIISPFMMKAKNKKEMDKAQKMINSIKKGDKVMTTSGVIGKAIGFEEKDGFKTITIETGDEKHKSYMTLDINAIYANLSAPMVENVAKKEESKPEEKVESKAENHDDEVAVLPDTSESRPVEVEQETKEEPVEAKEEKVIVAKKSKKTSSKKTKKSK